MSLIPALSNRDLVRNAGYSLGVATPERIAHASGVDLNLVRGSLNNLRKLGEFEKTASGWRWLCVPEKRPTPRVRPRRTI